MNLRAYLIGSVIVWVAIIAATAVLLSGTEYLVRMLPILGGGAVWSIVLAPTAMRANRTRADR